MMTNDGVEFESIIGGEKTKLKLIVENLDIERKCDTEYHLAYTELMSRGIMPRATLERRMEEKGIWSKSDDDRLQELQTSLVKLQIDLEGATTHEKGLVIASEMGKLRGECLKLVEVKAAVLSNACESLADQIRRDAYLAYATVYADTDKPVFKDYNDFLGRASEQVVIDAREAMLKIATQTFNDSLIGLPEVSYVRKVEGEIDSQDTGDTATATTTATRKARKTTARKTTRKKAATKKTPRKKS
jgi:hypothetical protein